MSTNMNLKIYLGGGGGGGVTGMVECRGAKIKPQKNAMPSFRALKISRHS